MVVGLDEQTFWGLTPKTIQVYFRAYQKRRETAIQDIWLQGYYMRWAIASTLSFSEKKPPDYPDMPFKEQAEEALAHDEEWLQKERIRAWNHFVAILNKKR